MKPTAIIVTIGDELLIGQVIDTNSAWMGQQLSALGITILEKVAVSDTPEGIKDVLEAATKKADIVLITGGLGPTKDDITKTILADFYTDEMVFDQETYDRIVKLFERWGKSTTHAHKQQCYMPASANLLANNMGTAPGMMFNKEGHLLVSMPGVPYEMKYLMETYVLPHLAENYLGSAIVHRTVQTAGEGESRIADRIQPIIDTFPEHITIAYLPNLGKVRLRLTATGTDKKELQKEAIHFSDLIAAELGNIVFGYDDDNLITAIGKLCLEKNITIGSAESCTGGKVAAMIVNEVGSSAFYQGSLITYSNELKMNMLEVKPDTLKQFGAVSEETVKEMVKGSISTLQVDVTVAISGIAGPTGGSDEKPVGTIWMACGTKDKVITKLVKAGKNREKNIEYASNYALDLMRKFLIAL